MTRGGGREFYEFKTSPALIVIVVSSVEDPDRIQLDPVFLGHPDLGDRIRVTGSGWPDPDPLYTKRPHVIQIFLL